MPAMKLPANLFRCLYSGRVDGGFIRCPIRRNHKAVFWQTCEDDIGPTGIRMSEENKTPEKLSIFQVFGSVMSSFLGVQKNETRERDFKRGRARDFIIVGIVLTVLFVFAVWGVVQLVMNLATKG
jgi:hypothetical protein